MQSSNKVQKKSLEMEIVTDNEALIPKRQTSGSAGYDLHSKYSVTVPAGEKMLVDTGVALAIPKGHVGQIWPRSGLAVKFFIDTGAGIIDSDFSGPLKVLLFNFAQKDLKIDAGDRIAQLLVIPVAYPEIVRVDSLVATERGENGFGSTGTK